MSRKTRTAALLLTLSTMLLGAFSLPVFAQDVPAAPKAANATEAIQRGLAYLKTHQAEDGAFRGGRPNPAMDIGITSLVLEAFAKSPEALRKDAAPALDKAAAFLLAQQKTDGGIRGEMLGTYTTSIALVALKAHDGAKYKDQIDRAVAYLKAQQCTAANGYDPKKDVVYGGYGYGGTEGRADLSNTQMVLDAFEAAGLKKDDPTYKDVLVFLNRCQNNYETNDQAFAGTDGGGIYNPAGSRDMEYTKPDGTKGLRSYGSMTYALLKSMIYADLKKDDPRVVAALGWIRANYTLDENPGVGQAGLYYYYHTFATALTAFGEDTLTDDKGKKHDWRKELAAKIISLQRPDGSWVNPTRDRWGENDPVLVTAYSILALQYTLDTKPTH